MPRPFPRSRADVEEAVDHRQAVALLVGQAGADQFAGLPVLRRLAIFDEIGSDRRLLDHVGEIALVHLGHAAARMADLEIALQQLVLLLRRPRLARGDFQVRMLAKHLALRGVGRELGRENANRHAGRAVDAAWTVGDRLAAAESDPPERLVELARMAARQFREHLPLDLARQIRTRRRIGHEEFREPERCAQADSPPRWLRITLCDW